MPALRTSIDSRYQNIAVGYHQGQYSVYGNGLWSYSFPDEYSFSALAHSAPDRAQNDDLPKADPSPGPQGRNLAAGMTGGTLFMWDPDWVAIRSLADTAPFARRGMASITRRWLLYSSW